MVGSVKRPVKELKGFKKIILKSGESKTVTITLKASELGFYNKQMVYAAEPGTFKVFFGGSSEGGLEGNFELMK